MTTRQRILLETTQARDKAAALLSELQRAKASSERHMNDAKATDPLRLVTGKSALDNAIASAQRMVDTLNRQLDLVRREMSDEDLTAAYVPEAGRG